MPTEKDAAEAERIIGDYYNERNMPKTAKVHYELADAFDPPKTEWVEGTIAWVTATDGDTRLCMRRKSAWATCIDSEGSTCVGIYEDEVAAKVEPLRVLADDEIAVPVVTKAVGALRDYADYLCREYSYANCGSAVISAYIEAVEDAEAGDQS